MKRRYYFFFIRILIGIEDELVSEDVGMRVSRLDYKKVYIVLIFRKVFFLLDYRFIVVNIS